MTVFILVKVPVWNARLVQIRVNVEISHFRTFAYIIRFSISKKTQDSEQSVPSSQLSFEGDDDGSKSLDAEAERLEVERLAKEQLEKAKVELCMYLLLLLRCVDLQLS